MLRGRVLPEEFQGGKRGRVGGACGGAMQPVEDWEAVPSHGTARAMAEDLRPVMWSLTLLAATSGAGLLRAVPPGGGFPRDGYATSLPTTGILAGGGGPGRAR